uniref:Uncharacterized protein n=1 Tax=Arundo donax TaxID=35708 RepID=A0A0A9AD23_ARUDO
MAFKLVSSTNCVISAFSAKVSFNSICNLLVLDRYIRTPTSGINF